ncbi:hypothetical protein CAPTEDRAFT_91140 [Capitella teleta]|uniref:Retinol dehydrogenase 14 n=1 Tax=Capitella teleta TaxID=283909 RepID=R7TX35_CAPTE|nr:hypothetical protein CAPTEDRAFT_91140 [Capitella teleta]|eukprot:ELT95535.1 hypothetical protein CAPTEDRAFT_91140 [Capitella teleta]
MWLYIVLIVIGYFAFGRFLKSRYGICSSRADLSGKTAIVTGANAGIGFQTALDLAKRKARVILACRNEVKGKEACTQIKDLSANNDVIFCHLDLSSMKSVRHFVKEIIQNESHLEILVNNAGIGYCGKGRRTEEGLHYLMASNLFGPFLLTNLLLDLLKSSNPSRIVFVSSIIFKAASIDLSNINMQQYEPAMGPYGVSKLANIMITRELSQRLQGTGVTVNCLHPGSIQSSFFNKFPFFLRVILQPIASLFFRSEFLGAQSSIHCAVSEEMEGVSGRYVEECRVTSLPPHATDANTARQLWDECSRLTQL